MKPLTGLLYAMNRVWWQHCGAAWQEANSHARLTSCEGGTDVHRRRLDHAFRGMAECVVA